MANTASKPTESYQNLKAQLDEVMSKLQADDVDVDEALVLYGQAQKLISELEKYLHKTEHSFKQIKLSP